MTNPHRLTAWLLAAAIVFATLGPPQYRPHSNFGQDGEHALAFVLIGLAFGIAYPRRRLLTAALSVWMIGALELLQLWAPGRHARFEDFAVDALAASAGFVMAAGFDFLMTWSRSALLRKSSQGLSPRGSLQTYQLLSTQASIDPASIEPAFIDDDFDQSMILTTRRVRGSTITRRSLTTA